MRLLRLGGYCARVFVAGMLAGLVAVGGSGAGGKLLAKSLRPIDFEVVERGGGDAPTLLIIGGIQGDEPGGFNATNIFLNHYKITRGSVWVVPVLNPHSMLQNHRGIYDDMNRKFSTLSPSDPEKPIIDHIKRVISDAKVDAVLHLHDGSGYYRPRFESKLANPNRWGNCTVIDQVLLEGARFGELEAIAAKMIAHINANLLAPIHRYHLHNTETAEKDTEMQKALTFYAISQGKPGYANEASKELNVAQRVYYHLLAIDSLLTQMGIEFTRDFELNPTNVQQALRDSSQTFAIENLPVMPLFGLRKTLASFPLPQGRQADEIQLTSENKILGLLPRGHALLLKYGNNVMTTILPKPIAWYQGEVPPITATVDGERRAILAGSRVQVARDITLPESIPLSDTQTLHSKIIGLANARNAPITKSALSQEASLDQKGRIYRVELYVREALPNTQESAQEQETQRDTPASWAQVSVNLANVRESSSIDSAIIARAPRGRVLEVLDSHAQEAGREAREKQEGEAIGGGLSERGDTGKGTAREGARALGSAGAKEPNDWAKVRYIFQGRLIDGYVLRRLLRPLANMAIQRDANPLDSRLDSRAQGADKQAVRTPYKEYFGGMILLEFSDNTQALK